MIRTTITPPSHVRVVPGPLLLAGVAEGAGLVAHRGRWGALPSFAAGDLLAHLEAAGIRGRGGAAFPFARKFATALASGRRREVVVNAAEGEPASAKDSALLLTAPHSVLDGAEIAASALGVSLVHVVTGADRPNVGAAVDRAITERDQTRRTLTWRPRVRFLHHVAGPRFVAGQARAVLELLSGGPGLPTTAWSPESVDGLRGHPTLLSNAETWAHVAAIARDLDPYLSLGAPHEPGTSLLTLTAPSTDDGSVSFAEATVVECDHGTSFGEALAAAGRPAYLAGAALLGGFHGMWVAEGALAGLPVSRLGLAEHSLALGAGAVMTLADEQCPVAVTARVVTYLAEESARRCGPCLNGLPELARQVRQLDAGADTLWRIDELAVLLEGRGACAHPDGTVRLVRSLLRTVPERIEAHVARRCPCQTASARALGPGSSGAAGAAGAGAAGAGAAGGGPVAASALEARS